MTQLNTRAEKKQFYMLVVSLVLPMAAQNLINVAVTSADVIMLGKVGETVLSASSLAGQVLFILTLVLFGLTSGAAVLTAQYWGKKDIGAIEKVLGISMRIALIVAGGLGNALDRFTLGYVVDFVDTVFISFPTFNVADIGVTCGFVLFFAGMLWSMRKDAPAKEVASEEK